MYIQLPENNTCSNSKLSLNTILKEKGIILFVSHVFTLYFPIRSLFSKTFLEEDPRTCTFAKA